MLERFMLLTALALSVPSFAAEILNVEAIVSPAWVQHADGAREPLTLGMSIRGKDKVLTASGARALLRLVEGSAIKLGENATLAVDDLEQKEGTNTSRLISASLEVIRGAFRFTTRVFAGQRADHDVKIRIRTVEAGIRGTDVWGKSTGEQDVVCLIEGKIDVRHGGRRFTMDDPMSFFIAPRTGEPKPVAPVSKEQLEKWIEETEIRAGKGGIRTGGNRDVQLFTSEDADAARQIYDKVRKAGFPAEIETVSESYGGPGYRVRIPDLPELEDAQAVAERLKALGFGGAEAVR